MDKGLKRERMGKSFAPSNEELDQLIRLLQALCKAILENLPDKNFTDIKETCQRILEIELPLNASYGVVDISQESKQVLTVLYCIVITFALVGNIGVIVVFAKNKSFRGAVTIPILSLAISNLLMALFCLPFTLIIVLSRTLKMDSFGEFLCKMLPYMETTNIVASTLTMGCIATERYLAVVYPLKSRNYQSTARTLVILACIWVSAVCIAVPNLLWHAIQSAEAEPLLFEGLFSPDGEGICAMDDKKTTSVTAYRFFICVGIFGLSFVAVTVAYIQISRHLKARKTPGNSNCPVEILHVKTSRRVITMLVVVQILFFVCWAPFLLYQALIPLIGVRTTVTNLNIYYYLHWWAACNSCQNPMVYTLLHEKFRRNFLAICCCGYPKKTKVQPVENSSNESSPPASASQK